MADTKTQEPMDVENTAKVQDQKRQKTENGATETLGKRKRRETEDENAMVTDDTPVQAPVQPEDTPSAAKKQKTKQEIEPELEIYYSGPGDIAMIMRNSDEDQPFRVGKNAKGKISIYQKSNGKRLKWFDSCHLIPSYCHGDGVGNLGKGTGEYVCMKRIDCKWATGFMLSENPEFSDEICIRYRFPNHQELLESMIKEIEDDLRNDGRDPETEEPEDIYIAAVRKILTQDHVDTLKGLLKLDDLLIDTIYEDKNNIKVIMASVMPKINKNLGKNEKLKNVPGERIKKQFVDERQSSFIKPRVDETSYEITGYMFAASQRQFYKDPATLEGWVINPNKVLPKIDPEGTDPEEAEARKIKKQAMEYEALRFISNDAEYTPLRMFDSTGNQRLNNTGIPSKLIGHPLMRKYASRLGLGGNDVANMKEGVVGEGDMVKIRVTFDSYVNGKLFGTRARWRAVQLCVPKTRLPARGGHAFSPATNLGSGITREFGTSTEQGAI